MTAIDLFTDASYAQHKSPLYFGIGCFMIDYKDDEKEYSLTTRIQFSSIENKIKKKYKNKIKGNLSIFELYAIIKGLKFAVKKAVKLGYIDTIRVYTDSLNVVESYYNFAEHPIIKGALNHCVSK
jgi:ribonuclease HI